MTISRVCAVAVAAVVALALPPLFADHASRDSAARAQDTTPSVSAQHLFEFHSGFWINLHHFLYEQAAIATAGPKGTPHEAELATDASLTAGLSEDESRAWSDALAYYRSNMLRHDLLSDERMVELKNHLEDLEDATTLARADIDPAVINALDEAAPIYQKYWWQMHNTANQTWIQDVMPRIDSNGATLSQQIATAFETPWPDHTIRVDVVAYANWAGSYTTLHPTRTTISSIDGGNQGVTALEIVFHEGSHAMVDKLRDDLSRDFAAQKKSAPPELWHALLFYTSGFYVKQLYPAYTPYADRFELWNQGDFTGYRPFLVKDWQPRLEGKLTLDAALSQLAADVPAPALTLAPPEVRPAPGAPEK